jgi:hypothetical protein
VSVIWFRCHFLAFIHVPWPSSSSSSLLCNHCHFMVYLLLNKGVANLTDACILNCDCRSYVVEEIYLWSSKLSEKIWYTTVEWQFHCFILLAHPSTHHWVLPTLQHCLPALCCVLTIQCPCVWVSCVEFSKSLRWSVETFLLRTRCWA